MRGALAAGDTAAGCSRTSVGWRNEQTVLDPCLPVVENGSGSVESRELEDSSGSAHTMHFPVCALHGLQPPLPNSRSGYVAVQKILTQKAHGQVCSLLHKWKQYDWV